MKKQGCEIWVWWACGGIFASIDEPSWDGHMRCWTAEWLKYMCLESAAELFGVPESELRKWKWPTAMTATFRPVMV